MARTRQLATLALVTTAFAALPASAAEEKGPDHSACFGKRQYDACFREGKARYGADAYEEAYAAYLEGWKLKPNYEVAGNLGNVELKLQKYDAAYTHLKYSIENLPPSQRGGEVESRLREKLAEALQHVGGRRFDTDPSGSEVTIDGERVDNGPLDLWIGIEPGERKLVVSKPGYATVERTLDIRAGSEEATSVVLVPAAEQGPDGPAPTTAEGPELNLPLVVIGSVVAVGAIGAGIGLHVAAAGKASDRQDITNSLTDPGACSGNPSGELAARCQQISELADQENTFSGAGTGLLIGGAVVGAAIGVYAIVVLTSGPDEGEPSATNLTVVPTFGPTENGLTLVGRF